ncbi:short-chain dehydrogenase/reductase (SDR family member), putative [Theileria annulata]|uniref:Short-chain dehydrogenase/reductase (SDR family member), putative n=1 Tax=Theileria annulata TaxID=5874 RepID=Q4U978_THEAN|nr:short-chain dehydrogenase/reductase (SDR family member), putative [Theileria annulata]CAI76625.1 short-chain dehydrogenase/reductase (SDR family member), putative [Theileria annulata]|eukprot:XP_953250.1 short-chain dehydrogenase/reductase (SDR family member), putative [Theileria annulata]
MPTNTSSPNSSTGNQVKDPASNNELSKPEKKPTTNPEAIYEFAFLMDPFLRCTLFIYSWVFYFAIEFLKCRFSIYRVATRSFIVFFMELEKKGRRVVLLTYFAQATVFLLLLFMFLNYYLSRGATLSRKVLKSTNLKGKVAIVTGGYSGIGLETVFQLLKWNCKVVIFGRDKTRATNAIERMKSTKSFDENNLYFIEMDLDNLTSVKNAASSFLNMFDRLDFLINNAGVSTGPLKNKNGLESKFSTNFLGHFYLTNLLLDLLKKTEGRVISLSSIEHYMYDPKNDKLFETKSTTSLQLDNRNNYYARSKLFIIWFTHALQRRLKAVNSNVLCLTVHPGKVWTKMKIKSVKDHLCYIPKRFLPYLTKSPACGAATTLYLCIAPSNMLIPGAYYCELNVGLVRRTAHDEENEEKLWNLAEEMVKNN